MKTIPLVAQVSNRLRAFVAKRPGTHAQGDTRCGRGFTPRLLPLRLSIAALLFAPTAPAEVQLERTFLPDAHASSFAFGLPGGVNVCYDPVRGGVNYAWTGGFLDITNVRPVNKLVKAAVPLGPIVYRETGAAPLRRGDALRPPVVEFKGYTLADATVELRYSVDGVLVRETLSALPNGAGLRRTFRVDRTGSDATWFYAIEGRPATALTRTAAGDFTLDVTFNAHAP